MVRGHLSKINSDLPRQKLEEQRTLIETLVKHEGGREGRVQATQQHTKDRQRDLAAETKTHDHHDSREKAVLQPVDERQIGRVLNFRNSEKSRVVCFVSYPVLHTQACFHLTLACHRQ